MWVFPNHSRSTFEAFDSENMVGSPIMAQKGCIFSQAVFLRCSLVGSQRPTERQRAELSWRSRLRRIFRRRAHIWMYPPIPPYIPPDAQQGGFSETLLMLTEEDFPMESAWREVWTFIQVPDRMWKQTVFSWYSPSTWRQVWDILKIFIQTENLRPQAESFRCWRAHGKFNRECKKGCSDGPPLAVFMPKIAVFIPEYCFM